MSAARETDTAFAVAQAPVWRLLWLWVPMLGVAAMIVATTLQSAQRTPHELGLPLRDGSVLVISPEQPRQLLEALQALAGPGHTH